MEYRIKLTKLNNLKFISHLDWQNTIQKMLRRNKVEFEFSQGFNPSPKIAFSPALPLGVESVCEFIDVRCQKPLPLPLNTIDGIEIINIEEQNQKPTPLDILCQWAKYKFYNVPISKSLLYNVEKVLSSDEIFIEKKNKKGLKKLINIRKSIKNIEIFEDYLEIVLKCGQNEEIPSLRADEFSKILLPQANWRIRRVHFYDIDFKEL